MKLAPALFMMTLFMAQASAQGDNVMSFYDLTAKMDKRFHRRNPTGRPS